MRYILLFCLIIFLWGCGEKGDTNSADAPVPEIVDFNFHVKPILSDRCFACHGPDARARKADLRLDIAEGVFDTLAETGNVPIVAGNVKASEVHRRIVSDDPEMVMPPPESNLTLSPREIAILNKWIEQGAEYKQHWSFIPPEKPEVPALTNSSFVKNDIDPFILQKLKQRGMKPETEDDKAKLLRRLSFDLTGLPPTKEELDDFLADHSADAWEKQVDRVLASPHFGERMASIWLDAARYADSHGYQDDRPRTIWPWRDWVIRAYNDNLSYKDFITWQLAGDLLPESSYDQKLATAFNRNHAITQEGGVINEEYITEYVADRTNTFGAAFLGLTLECSRCHDHKYDPVSQKDYYSIFSFFNSIDERGQVSYFDLAPSPNMRVEDAELEATIDWLDSMRVVKEKELHDMETQVASEAETWIKKTDLNKALDTLVRHNLLAWHKLDDYANLMVSNSANPNLPGKANVKLISELNSPLVVEGKEGKALQFDGKNYLSLGDVGDFEESARFSFGGWVKPAALQEKAAGLFVKRNGEQKQGGYELVMNPKGQLEGALVHDKTRQKIVVKTRNRIPVGEWSHTFMTYDGSGRAEGITIYINGEPQQLEIIADSLNRKSILNGNDFLIGNWTPRRANSGYYFGFENGAIDGVRIYAKELTSLEVSHLAGKNAPAGNTHNRYPEDINRLYLESQSAEYLDLRYQLDSIRDVHLEIPEIMIMEEMEEPRESFVLARGAYDAPGERVYPNTPASILPFPEDFPQNRLGLAMWLTHPEHPLTARVAVNRLWQMMFGRGLVNTPEDFGNQGELPSHPELLDWLAVTFMENNWDIKGMLKLMAMSGTYRQKAEISPEKQKKDPVNIWLARGPYKRLSAEMVRDQVLAVSGLLNPKIGGKWVKPYQPPGIWKELANQIGENKYRPGRGPELYRRSIYSYWKRTIPPPVMLTFDASERAVCVVKRQSTSTPLQALVLLNDPTYVEAARALAARVMATHPGEKPEDWIAEAWLRITSDQPDDADIALLSELYEKEYQRFKEQPSAAEEYLREGEYRQSQEIDIPRLAALSVVVNLMFNLDEAKMKS